MTAFRSHRAAALGRCRQRWLLGQRQGLGQMDAIAVSTVYLFQWLLSKVLQTLPVHEAVALLSSQVRLAHQERANCPGYPNR